MKRDFLGKAIVIQDQNLGRWGTESARLSPEFDWGADSGKIQDVFLSFYDNARDFLIIDLVI